MYTLEQLINEVETYRVKQNLSKSEMARKLKITRMQYWYWLAGKSLPHSRKQFYILQFLGKPISVKEYQYWQKKLNRRTKKWKKIKVSK